MNIKNGKELDKKFALNLIMVNGVHDGTQLVYKFDNGFGASLVNHSFAYGGRELAVLLFGDTKDITSWIMAYFTPITNDVEGYLTIEETNKLLNRIQKLNPKHIKKWVKKYNPTDSVKKYIIHKDGSVTYEWREDRLKFI